MSTSCIQFRQHLEALLEGKPNPQSLTALGWHDHLLNCGACRELLEQEEALEHLLASLPDPNLPPDLSRKVLLRLRQAEPLAPSALRESALETLLSKDEVEVPAGLAARVRAGVAAARLEGRLDALLEQALVVDVPQGLSQRIRAGLGEQRELAYSSVPMHGARPVGKPDRSGLRLKLAAALLIGASGVALWRGLVQQETEGPDPLLAEGPSASPSRPEADEEVIDHLSELLYWESIESLDPVARDLLSELDLVDEALLDTALEAEGS